ncbi:MAG: hypothetical protein WCP85_31490 [Mariniphaga sp.]
MKQKIAVWYLFLAFCITFFMCCSKKSSNLVSPVIPIEKPKYTVSISGLNCIIDQPVLQVISGSPVDLSWKLQIGFEGKSISVNGIIIPLKSTEYHISAVNSNINIEIITSITPLGILIRQSWNVFSDKMRNTGETTWSNTTNPRTGYYQFFETSKYKHFTNDGLVGDGPFILKSDSLIIGNAPNGSGGIRYIINQFDETRIELVSTLKYQGSPVMESQLILVKR